MAIEPGFSNTITSQEALSELYRAPSELVMTKATQVLDRGCRDLIALSTFVLIGTASSAGLQDVSPKGGPAGFVKVIDDKRIAIPDLNGNNRLDSIRNLIDNPQIGLLFVIPGLGETLRVNGSACVTTDDAMLDLFTDELRRPKTAIGVTIDEAYIHCAKSFRRGSLWEPDQWPKAEQRPSVGDILLDHTGMESTMTGPEFDAQLESSYAKDLEEDLPVR